RTLAYIYPSRRALRPSLFPTRRSSDLVGRGAHGGQACGGARGARFDGLLQCVVEDGDRHRQVHGHPFGGGDELGQVAAQQGALGERKSTRLNSSHVSIAYAVFCLEKKT